MGWGRVREINCGCRVWERERDRELECACVRVQEPRIERAREREGIENSHLHGTLRLRALEGSNIKKE